MSRAAVVLCGGRSSRMGRAKAWLPWFGQTMIEHVVSVLSLAVDEIVVVTSATLELPSLSRLGARVVRDQEPGRGPLAGIRDGLRAIESDAEFAFVTSTDAPFLTERFITELFDRKRACAPISEGFVQVLSAVYPVAVGAEVGDRLLDAGTGRPRALLEALDYEAVEAADVVADGATPAWHGFNTPAAYLEAVLKIDPEASAEVELVDCAAQAGEDTLRRVRVGTLAEVMRVWPASLELTNGDEMARPYQAVFAGNEIVSDLGVPVGPGERVRIQGGSGEKP